ncbi:MAG: lysoplasmalogenase [Candidatus Thorarchaeota archaeon]|nr:lysoplasmalogenase [Candidatus Thorarchaeota archaeon]
MSIEVYAVLFWIFAAVGTFLKDKYAEHPRRVVSRVTAIKIIPALIAIIYVVLTQPSPALFYILLSVALVFCMLGDIGMEKDIVAGIGMFLIGHIIFTVNFLWQASNVGLVITNLVVPIACMGGLSVFVLLFIGYLRSSGPEVPDLILKAGTLYFLMISATFSTSLLLWLTTGNIWGLIPVIGALFFLISDSLIAINQFHHKISHAQLFIMPTYFLSIFLLALGVFVYIF